MSHTKLYTYMAEGVGNTKGSSAFRALKRGYVHWASGRMKKLEVQTRHPSFTFVHSTVIPSMRSGTCSVKLLLENRTVQGQVIGEVCQASCECAAGYIHVSVLPLSVSHSPLSLPLFVSILFSHQHTLPSTLSFHTHS